MRDGDARLAIYAPKGLPYSGARRVAAITPGSGASRAKAVSKVARLMPCRAAWGHSPSRNVKNELSVWLVAGALTQKNASASNARRNFIVASKLTHIVLS